MPDNQTTPDIQSQVNDEKERLHGRAKANASIGHRVADAQGATRDQARIGRRLNHLGLIERVEAKRREGGAALYPDHCIPN
jgi:protein subunit release factor A